MDRTRVIAADDRAWKPVRGLVYALAAVSGLAVAGMALITCLDIVLRLAGRPLKGTYDLVRVLGAVAMGCALPLTTATKGHIAIEVLYLRLGRIGRVVVDTLMRLVLLGILAVAAWQCVAYGSRLLRSQEVTPTLQLPLFWVPWVLAAACGVTALVTLYHLLYPGREMIRP